MVSIEKNLSMCLEDETVRSAQAAVLDAIEDHLNSVEEWRKIEENPDIMYENQLNEKRKVAKACKSTHHFSLDTSSGGEKRTYGSSSRHDAVNHFQQCLVSSDGQIFGQN